MTMINLVFWACLSLSASSCQEVTLTFIGDGEGRPVSAHSCLLRGQLEMARWISEHPGYVVGVDPVRRTAYRCGGAQMARK